MKRDDLEYLEKVMMELVVQKRQLGGYSAEADAILKISEALLKVVQHLVEISPKRLEKKK